MRRVPGIRAGIRRLFRLPLRRAHLTRADVDREIAFHLDARTERLIAQGMDPAAARETALRFFGDVDRARETLVTAASRHEARRARREQMGAIVDDLRYVLRVLGRSRAFTAVIVLTLALAIGANAAMFGIIDRLLLRGPEHVRAPERLRRLYVTTSERPERASTRASWGYVTYAMLRDHARTLDGVAAYSSAYYVLGSGAESESIVGHLVTHDYFRVLGVRPALGRFFTADEDRPPFGERVVVLEHGLWERRFGADSAVVGRTVTLQGEPYRVVGVAPRGFTGAELWRVGVWTPMSLSRTRPDWPTTWRAQWMRIVARLGPGVSARAASAEATQLHRRFYGGRSVAMRSADLDYRPLTFTESGREPPESAVSRWLTGVTIIVLLIASANVANLLLARATRRRREIAVRLALGVSRARLVRLVLAEGLVLCSLGCVAGCALAYWGGGMVRAMLLPDVAWSSPLDARVVGATVVLALLTAILVGLGPLWQARTVDLNNALKAGAPQSGSSRSPTRTVLLFAQAAFSLVLLIGAGLFIRSVQRASHLDLGFEPERALVASIAWPEVQRTDADDRAERARRRVVHETALRRLRTTPGVEHAAIAVGTPFGNAYGVDLRVPGWDSLPDLGGGGPFVNAATPGYFEAAGMHLLQGRTFQASDGAGTPLVTIVNEPMARALWPGANALGKCLHIFERERPCASVVGVVAESRRFALREPPAMQYWVPYGQESGIGGSTIIVRPSGDLYAFVPALRRILLETDPAIIAVQISSMQDTINPLTRSWRTGATVFTVLGLLALAMAAVGLYSMLAYVVAQRTHEFGVRRALGATPGHIVALVVRGGMRPVMAGIVGGLTAAFLAAPYIRSLLFETSPYDLVATVVAAIALIVAALLACYIPARRGSREDVLVALRAE